MTTTPHDPDFEATEAILDRIVEAHNDPDALVETLNLTVREIDLFEVTEAILDRIVEAHNGLDALVETLNLTVREIDLFEATEPDLDEDTLKQLDLLRKAARRRTQA